MIPRKSFEILYLVERKCHLLFWKTRLAFLAENITHIGLDLNLTVLPDFT